MCLAIVETPSLFFALMKKERALPRGTLRCLTEAATE